MSPGLDPDAWYLLLAARHIAEHHHYTASRLPGYPIPEYFFSLLAGLPIWVDVGATVAVSLVGFIAYRKILRAIGTPEARLASLAFACTPVVLVNCFTTMDYLWALSLALLAFLFAQKRKSLLAGIFLGLSIGCRITSVLMAGPIAYLLFSLVEDARERRTHLCQFLGAGIIVGAVSYTPVIATYGFAFLTHARRSALSWGSLLKTITIDTFGIIGTVAIAAGIMHHLLTRSNPRADRFSLSHPWKVVSWIVVCCYCILFAYLPLEAGYLIPVIPFALILLQHYWSAATFRIVALGLVLSPFVLGIDANDRPWSAPDSPASVRMNISGRSLSLDVFQGPLVHDFLRRSAQRAYADSVFMWCNIHAGERASLVTGVWFPILSYLADRDFDNNREGEFRIGRVRVTGLLDKENVLDEVRSATRLYFLPGQEKYERDVYGINIEQWGATPIQLQ